MKVKGQVKFSATEKTEFYAVLKKRVDDYFREKNISKNANATMIIKSIALIGLYLLSFAAILFFDISFAWALLCWTLMGLGIAGIGMSVMHDANHGAYSSSSIVNNLMGYTLNMCGGAVFNWKLQHNILHHTYTNITHMDEDIEDRLVLKFSPHTNTKGYHRFQYLYAFGFYGLLTLYWVVAKDFVQYYQFTRNKVNPNNEAQNKVLLMRIIATKIIYLLFVVAMPVFVFHIPFLQVLVGFLLMHFVAGIILTVVFQLAHTVEGTTHPLPVNGTIENDWAIHQMHTTVNFSPGNKMLSWYVGGLNFQVEHHLFPRICHVHYPAIAPIVKATAKEYGIPYLENKTFMGAVQSHMNLLHKLGRLPSANEAIG